MILQTTFFSSLSTICRGFITLSPYNEVSLNSVSMPPSINVRLFEAQALKMSLQFLLLIICEPFMCSTTRTMNLGFYKLKPSERLQGCLSYPTATNLVPKMCITTSLESILESIWYSKDIVNLIRAILDCKLFELEYMLSIEPKVGLRKWYLNYKIN